MIEGDNERAVKRSEPATVSDTEESSPHGASIIALSEWLETAPGRYVFEWELRQFDALVADIFGFNAVQIGLLEMPTLRSNRMPFVITAGEPQAEIRNDARRV